MSKVEVLRPSKKVDSSNIEDFYYITEEKLLVITFKRKNNSGIAYQFFDVSLDRFKGMESAASCGKYFNANIKNQYKTIKLG